MVCPFCSKATSVANSRKQRRTNAIWRRRQCAACKAVFTTLEGIDLSSVLRVAHTPTALEAFSRDHLFISIYECCRHRPAAVNDAANLSQQITSLLIAQQSQPGLVLRNDIIKTARSVLTAFDTTAATLYAAYHPL